MQAEVWRPLCGRVRITGTTSLRRDIISYLHIALGLLKNHESKSCDCSVSKQFARRLSH